MKFKNILAVGLLACFAAVRAHAQADTFAAPRTLVLLEQSSAAASTSNANYADIHGFVGVAKIDMATLPDNAAGTMAVTVQTSSDTTNWSTLGNVAFAVSNSVKSTNFVITWSGGTNVYATNVYNLAGTVTTPTANSAGFATPYLGSIPSFSSSAIFTNTGPVLTTIGFIPNDANPYIRFYIIKGGTGTNYAFSATLTGFKQQQ